MGDVTHHDELMRQQSHQTREGGAGEGAGHLGAGGSAAAVGAVVGEGGATQVGGQRACGLTA